MIGTIARYFNLFFITFFILVILSFVLAFFLPGDPILNLTGMPLSELSNTDYSAALAEQRYLSAFWFYVQELLMGQWGVSFASNAPLYEELATVLPATLELTLYATLLSLIIGIPIGFLCGLNHKKLPDYSFMGVSMVMYSFPVFWLGLLFILIVCLQLGWLPMSGRISLLYDVEFVTGFILLDIALSNHPLKQEAFLDALAHLILPTLSVSFITIAVFLRTTRRAVTDVIETDYIAAAQTRGLTSRVIFFRHILRNTLLAVLPLLAMQVSTIVTNIMIVETIFDWPGVGNWLIQAIYTRDFTAIRMGMLIVSTIVVLITFSIECISQLFNPARERFSYA